MSTKGKLKAFTLSEMVVVIILTSIIVGMAFAILTLVQRHMNGIRDNFEKQTELNKLEQALALDFNRYNGIAYNDFEDNLSFTTEMDSITYTFTKEHIIKDRDTFKIPIHGKQLYFDGNKVGHGPIDAIKLETSKAFQNQYLFIFKQNDATQFMD